MFSDTVIEDLLFNMFFLGDFKDFVTKGLPLLYSLDPDATLAVAEDFFKKHFVSQPKVDALAVMEDMVKFYKTPERVLCELLVSIRPIRLCHLSLFLGFDKLYKFDTISSDEFQTHLSFAAASTMPYMLECVINYFHANPGKVIRENTDRIVYVRNALTGVRDLTITVPDIPETIAKIDEETLENMVRHIFMAVPRQMKSTRQYERSIVDCTRIILREAVRSDCEMRIMEKLMVTSNDVLVHDVCHHYFEDCDAKGYTENYTFNDFFLPLYKQGKGVPISWLSKRQRYLYDICIYTRDNVREDMRGPCHGPIGYLPPIIDPHVEDPGTYKPFPIHPLAFMYGTKYFDIPTRMKNTRGGMIRCRTYEMFSHFYKYEMLPLVNAKPIQWNPRLVSGILAVCYCFKYIDMTTAEDSDRKIHDLARRLKKQWAYQDVDNYLAIWNKKLSAIKKEMGIDDV